MYWRVIWMELDWRGVGDISSSKSDWIVREEDGQEGEEGAGLKRGICREDMG